MNSTQVPEVQEKDLKHLRICVSVYVCLSLFVPHQYSNNLPSLNFRVCVRERWDLVIRALQHLTSMTVWVGDSKVRLVSQSDICCRCTSGL